MMHIDRGGQNRFGLVGQVYLFNYDITNVDHGSLCYLVRCCQFNLHGENGISEVISLIYARSNYQRGVRIHSCRG